MRALSWILQIHGLTLRYHVKDGPGYFSGGIARPVIFVMWHNRIVSMPMFYRRCRKQYGLNALVLTSAGPEGGLLAEVLRHFHLGAVRGSSSRRASVAIREMARRLAEGYDLIITPDGSRGPRYCLQPGALYLAQATGRPIIPVQVEYSRYLRFKTWDGFAIPLPFARVDIQFHKAFWINDSGTAETFEAERQRLERAMTESLVMDGLSSAR
jgi:lysophospholipid acyltransferase (LPLAT)-like uncharacterized protein